MYFSLYPLSPYLFLLGTDDLISLLNQVGTRKQISGVRICKGASVVNHLLFADDSVLFYKASIQENMEVQRILGVYENASRQNINRENMSMIFSKNVPSATTALILGNSSCLEL